MNCFTKVSSPLGLLTISSDGINVTGLWIEGQKYFADTLGKDTKEDDLPIFTQTKKWLDQYFTGQNPDFELPLAPKGSPFRQQVWQILCTIPFGQVKTYGEIAKQIGKNMSAQAVGGAVGHNPISIIIPCHRVVGSDGSLTGYAGGLAKKIQLLKLEKAPVEKFYLPTKGTAL